MKSARKNSGVKPKDEALSFEQAIQRLERIVTEMESAELPLQEVLSKYEEGTRLVRFCGQKLEEAEKKIELLTKKADGSIELKPLAGEQTTASGDEDQEEEDGDDGRLF
jgi:exodeoxyribonuclease VII small subunit